MRIITISPCKTCKAIPTWEYGGVSEIYGLIVQDVSLECERCYTQIRVTADFSNIPSYSENNIIEIWNKINE